MLKNLILLIGVSIIIVFGAVFSLSNFPSEKNLDVSNNELSKKIQESFKLGNFFDNGLKSGMTSTTLEQENQKASIRFTNSLTGMVSNITLSVYSPSSQQVIIGLQEDDGTGKPTGKWIDDAAINKTILSKDLSRTFTFPDDFLITKNKIYHIVIEPSQSNTTNKIKIKHYQANTLHQPYNPDNPDSYFDDSSINSLYFDGEKWIEKEKWPIFLISFNDGKKIGQPYTLAAGWVIRDKTWVGQTFIPSFDYIISKIGFVVSKEGDPNQPLFYGIQDSENNILSTGFFTESEQLSRGKNWVEVTLNEPVFLESEKLYRIYLYSPIPKEEEFYRVYGHEYSFDYSTGYGELRHRLTISHDNGELWSAWNDADAIFKLTT